MDDLISVGGACSAVVGMLGIAGLGGVTLVWLLTLKGRGSREG